MLQKVLDPRVLIPVALFPFASVHGYVVGKFGESAPNQLMYLVVAAALTFWVVVDCRRRKETVSLGSQFDLFFFWPLAIPAYLIWHYRWWGLAITFLARCITWGCLGSG